MPRFMCLLLLPFLTVVAVFAQSAPLIQINNYGATTPPAPAASAAPQRVTIDVGNPAAVQQFLAQTDRRVTVDMANAVAREQFLMSAAPALYAQNRVTIDTGPGFTTEPEPMMAARNAIPWEGSRVFYTTTGEDSFLVSVSRTGCPGTEAAPSVAVAYSNGQNWSTPVRFGPLTDVTTCRLGAGYKLTVSAEGEEPPRVCLEEPQADLYGER